MDDQESQAWITKRLGASANREDLLHEICTRTNCTWDQAKGLLEQVELEKKHEIARRQLPLTFSLALGVFVVGLLLTAYGAYGLILYFTPEGRAPDDLTTYIMPIIEDGKGPLDVLLAALPAYVRFGIYFLWSPFTAIFIGLSMIAGSLLGMRSTWTAILFKE